MNVQKWQKRPFRRMGDTAYSVCTFLVTFFNIAPFCWHIEHRNSGPICLGFWVIVLNLNGFINSVAWRHDALDRAPVWCDISIKLYLGGPIGLLCANICITRFLAMVLSPSATQMTPRDHRRRAIFDYILCFGFPLFIFATHIIYQPNRYAIARYMGCTATLVITWPTLVLWLAWMPLLALIGSLFSLYILSRLIQHRRSFRNTIHATSAITVSRFIRLTLLCSAYFLVTLPLSIYFVIFQIPAAGGYIEYDWGYIHHYFDVITFYPFVTGSNFADWLHVIAGILVLVFFGFAGEAGSYYEKLWILIRGDRCWNRLKLHFPSTKFSHVWNRGEEKKRELRSVCTSDVSPKQASFSDAEESKTSSDKESMKELYVGPFGDAPLLNRAISPLPIHVERIEDCV